MTIVQKQRWYTKITLKINPDYQSTFIALIDLGADLNCIQEGLIPTVYFVKTSQRLSTASNDHVRLEKFQFLEKGQKINFGQKSKIYSLDLG